MKIQTKEGKFITLKKILTSVLALAISVNLLSCDMKQDNTIRLTWAVPGDRNEQFDEVEAEINKITVDRLGISLKFDFIKSGDYQNRVNAKIESGENLDLCFTGDLDSYQARVSDNRLMNLNELLSIHRS